MKTKLTRRGFAATGLAALAAMTTPAVALTTAEAKALIGDVVRDINRVIASGKSEAAMIRDFEKILAKYGDMPIIAQTILGRPWREASAAQRRAFTDALQGYLSRKYGRQFRKFIGGEIKVESARSVNRFFEVKSSARLQGSAPFDLVFLVSDRSGSNKFFNMLVDGINLRTTENVEINAILDRNRGDIDGLIRDLQKVG